MKFLIQTVDGEITHDFSFVLLESIRFQNWMNPNSIEYKLIDGESITPMGYIPIGSVEFVSKYLKDHHKIEVDPINIPNELLGYKWTGRKVINGTEKDIVGEKFVKSNDKIKLFTEICDTAPKGNYQISDLIDITSEWRAFVFDGKLVGLQNYSGEFDCFPDVNRIREMVSEYKSQPISFTLDVAVGDVGTVIIEVHDFFSCGLYGFSEHKLLPYMFSNWFFRKVNNIE